MKIWKFVNIIQIYKEIEKISGKNKNVTPINLVNQIIWTLEDSKANDIISIDLRKKSSIADYMIIAEGNSTRQVSSIAQKVIEKLKKLNIKKISYEGLIRCDWVLLDAGDIIVNIFRPEIRQFYNLERIWMREGNAETIIIGND